MKRFALACLLVVTVSASLLEKQGAEFQTFKLQHGKIYKNQAEETKRFKIYRDNLEKIAAHNARYEQGLETYTLATNQFADMTAQEFSAMLGYQAATKPKLNITETFEMPEGVQAPASVDWRTQNHVTPVKNQEQCGSCWAFAITGSTEGAYARKTGSLVALSEQQLVDCTSDINFGCSGGYLEDTFPYVMKNGLQSETSYPYKGVDGTCKYSSSSVVTHVSSYVTVRNNEEQLKNAVGTVGPVSVAINADYLQFYFGGVFHNARCDPYSLNHGVLIVGYTSEYWIIKNSWGSTWGESGYFRFKYGVNECGVTMDNVYPVIN